jgi:hypothetical protein
LSIIALNKIVDENYDELHQKYTSGEDGFVNQTVLYNFMMSVLEIFDPIKYNVGPFTSAPKKNSSLSTHVLEKIDELYD